jgi:hypothetical protein
MRWVAPSEKDTDTATLEKRLWDAADQFCANSGLKAQEYSAPVLGLYLPAFRRGSLCPPARDSRGTGHGIEDGGLAMTGGARISASWPLEAEPPLSFPLASAK